MADDDLSQKRPPMNVYTAMLLLSFVAIATGCLFLALEFYSRNMPPAPGP